MVEACLLDAAGMGDVVHRRFGVSFAGEEVPRVLEDRLLAYLECSRIRDLHVD